MNTYIEPSQAAYSLHGDASKLVDKTNATFKMLILHRDIAIDKMESLTNEYNRLTSIINFGSNIEIAKRIEVVTEIHKCKATLEMNGAMYGVLKFRESVGEYCEPTRFSMLSIIFICTLITIAVLSIAK